MNKKKLIMPVGLFLMVGLVMAGLVSYYGLFQTELEITQPISIDGNLEQYVSCYAGTNCNGEEVTINNEAPFSVDVQIDSYEEEGIETSYISELTLSQKIVDFSLDVWEIDTEGDTAKVKYTLVGDQFSAEVIEGSKEGYVLVYYKDNSDRFNSPAEAILLEDVEGNLPYETDKNNDEYDYCLTEEYNTCHGSKIWYVPSDSIIEGELDWSRANEFLYETSLIQYNSEGIITIYPETSIDLVPSYSTSSALESGLYIMNNQINPIQ